MLKENFPSLEVAPNTCATFSSCDLELCRMTFTFEYWVYKIEPLCWMSRSKLVSSENKQTDSRRGVD